MTIAAARPIEDEPKSHGRMRVYASAPGPPSSRELVHDGYVGIELRGRSSLVHFPKKQFGFELLTDGDVETEEPLLGMPAESDWVLHGPYADKSLLRNALTFELARRMGRYAPRSAFVELFLREGSGPTTYQGVYLLTEKVSRGLERIDLPRSRGRRGEDTGYLLKLDWEDPDVPETLFVSPAGVRVIVVYPGTEAITEEQSDYLERYVGSFEKALEAGTYEELIDVDSFVDAMISQELSNNVDGYRSSTFLYKLPGGKLHLGPLWDFNQAYGNASYNPAASGTEGFRAERLAPSHWMHQLLDDDVFRSRFSERYAALRRGPLSDVSVLAWIDAQAAMLAEPARRNFERWPILGTVVLGNPDPPPASYVEEVESLKRWLTARAAWLDRALR